MFGKPEIFDVLQEAQGTLCVDTFAVVRRYMCNAATGKNKDLDIDIVLKTRCDACTVAKVLIRNVFRADVTKINRLKYRLRRVV